MAETPKATTRCRCARCRIRNLTGPVMLIAIGAIFLAGEYTPYGFVTLWPILLVVPGLLLLAQSAASNEGHVDSRGHSEQR
ncbi:MAG: LiaI-LiaF-like domain-containing protein [Candidatus Acidiferrales bacterium]